jgi:hypothetical protein
MIKIFIISFFIFIVIFQPVNAQEIGVKRFPLTVKSNVHIINRANQSLKFAIRPQNGVWDNYDIKSGKSITISCNNCSTDYFEFLMKTGDRQVNYSLPSGERFVLEWNQNKNLWDIFTVTK